MYYVYIHKKPNGEVFYVGKGVKGRAWSKHGRNPHWNNVVKKACYFNVEIVEADLQEWYAFELEENLIAYYGLKSEGGVLCNLTSGGGGNGSYKFTNDDKLKISAGTTGCNNGRYDSTIRDFINIETKETFKGTKFDFEQKYNFTIRDVISGRVKTSMGWTLQEIYDHDPNLQSKRDVKKYHFTHKSGEEFIGTRQEFKTTHGFDPKNLFRSEKYRNKTLHGWSVVLTFQNCHGIIEL